MFREEFAKLEDRHLEQRKSYKPYVDSTLLPSYASYDPVRLLSSAVSCNTDRLLPIVVSYDTDFCLV
jgi:hypothetical protein